MEAIVHRVYSHNQFKSYYLCIHLKYDLKLTGVDYSKCSNPICVSMLLCIFQNISLVFYGNGVELVGTFKNNNSNRNLEGFAIEMLSYLPHDNV